MTYGIVSTIEIDETSRLTVAPFDEYSKYDECKENSPEDLQAMVRHEVGEGRRHLIPFAHRWRFLYGPQLTNRRQTGTSRRLLIPERDRQGGIEGWMDG